MKFKFELLLLIVIFIVLGIALTTYRSRTSIVGRWQQDGQDVFEFFSDGTFVGTAWGEHPEMGVWRVSGNRLAMSNWWNERSEVVDFSISRDLLILKSDDWSRDLVLIRLR